MRLNRAFAGAARYFGWCASNGRLVTTTGPLTEAETTSDHQRLCGSVGGGSAPMGGQPDCSALEPKERACAQRGSLCTPRLESHPPILFHCLRQSVRPWHTVRRLHRKSIQRGTATDHIWARTEPQISIKHIVGLLPNRLHFTVCSALHRQHRLNFPVAERSHYRRYIADAASGASSSMLVSSLDADTTIVSLSAEAVLTAMQRHCKLLAAGGHICASKRHSRTRACLLTWASADDACVRPYSGW